MYDMPAVKDFMRQWQYYVALGFIITAAVTVGHDGRRIAQLILLAMPVVALWAYRPSQIWGKWLCNFAIWSWSMLFIGDALIRTYLNMLYGAAPHSAMVQGAVANTQVPEIYEYARMYMVQGTLLTTLFVALGFIIGVCLVRRQPWPSVTWQGAFRKLTLPAKMVCGIIVCAVIVAYAADSWRRHHPVLFWADWVHDVQSLRRDWSNQDQARASLLQAAYDAQPTRLATKPRTIMLVITDSVNRDNMSLYGYARQTTPLLQARHKTLAPALRVYRQAWSVDASTIPAIRNMFRFGVPDSENPQHVLALAKAAGYKIWWISNHDDLSIEQKHAGFADKRHMVNNMPGRSSVSLDEAVLPDVHKAMADSSPYKLIIVHLMGAHPHYYYRFPEGDNVFKKTNDTVDQKLDNKGRAPWVAHFRDQYDSALLYHDRIVTKLLDVMVKNPKAEHDMAWIYISDHGQEVGHYSNHTGHGPQTASGYKIPFLTWQSKDFALASGIVAPDSNIHQPFRADWLGWSLMQLLGVSWAGYEPKQDILNKAYKWQLPSLPVDITPYLTPSASGQ